MKFIIMGGIGLCLIFRAGAQVDAHIRLEWPSTDLLNLSTSNQSVSAAFKSHRIDNNYIILEWAFGGQGPTEFRLERLLPAEAVYETIAILRHRIKKDEPSVYQYIDENSYYDASVYRLKCIPEVGPEYVLQQFHLSGISTSIDASAVVDVFPNPTQSQLFIDLQKIARDSEGVVISLLSNTGQLLHQYTVASDGLIHYPSRIVKQLSPALYTLRFDFQDGGQLFKQFLKR